MKRVALAAITATVVATAGFGPAAYAQAPSATVTCATPSVPMYHVDARGQLRRWSYASPLDGTSGWTEQQIGVGWNGLDVFSGGDGVIYTIDASGNLRWYLDGNPAGGSESWGPGSGAVIGSGWSGLADAFSGGQGVIYTIDSAGDLRRYQYVGTGGSSAWAPGSGAVIGSGWDGFADVFAGGQGVIYSVDSAGDLSWYRDQNPTTGTAGWANAGSGTPIGAGFAMFTEIGSMGGGVIFGRDAAGSLWWYRDTDPLGGSRSWADSGLGVNEGVGWGPSQVVTDIGGCVAS